MNCGQASDQEELLKEKNAAMLRLIQKVIDSSAW